MSPTPYRSAAENAARQASSATIVELLERHLREGDLEGHALELEIINVTDRILEVRHTWAGNEQTLFATHHFRLTPIRQVWQEIL